jgi:GMP synthase-like glutamine amidotransferase
MSRQKGEGMLTLVVDSYGEKYKDRVANYLNIVAKFSDLRLIEEKEARPNYKMSPIDAVVLSGSEKYFAMGDYELGFLEFIQRVRVPLLGVCYGHQALAAAHGQKVLRGPKLIRRKFKENPERVKIDRPGGLFAGLGPVILADESHREEVVLTDRNFELLASSASCEVESIRLRGTSHFGVQFHLERSGEYGIDIMRNFYRMVRQHEKK